MTKFANQLHYHLLINILLLFVNIVISRLCSGNKAECQVELRHSPRSASKVRRKVENGVLTLDSLYLPSYTYAKKNTIFTNTTVVLKGIYEQDHLVIYLDTVGLFTNITVDDLKLTFDVNGAVVSCE